MEEKNSNRPSTVFKVGAISLAFLIIGYETALFVTRASILRMESVRDHPDTVYVVDGDLARRLLSQGDREEDTAPEPVMDPLSEGGGGKVTVLRESAHSERVESVREMTRRVESFRFNPNTVSEEDLRRLGFSGKQAAAIENYRKAGGRFRRKEDFARSFVVADSVFARLENYICIPKIDINKADSASFDDLPGIGPHYASKMVEYRKKLGGYSYPEQLMDIYRFDRQKFDALSDLICCSPPEDSFALWSLPAEALARHPYIRNLQVARGIVLYRENNPRTLLTVEGLSSAGVLPQEDASRLGRCVIAAP